MNGFETRWREIIKRMIKWYHFGILKERRNNVKLFLQLYLFAFYICQNNNLCNNGIHNGLVFAIYPKNIFFFL